MLKSVSELQGYTVLGADEQLGTLDSFFFHEKTWDIEYLVVDTTQWLPGRKVLVATDSVSRLDEEARLFATSLTQAEVQESPHFDLSERMSRQQEASLRHHYDWPPVERLGGGLMQESKVGVTPDSIVETIQAHEQTPGTETLETETDARLGHTARVRGYHIQARDGEVGHVEDFIISPKSWNILYAVVDTRNWLPGRTVLISPSWIERIDWEAEKVEVDLTQETIKNSPEYDSSQPLDESYQAKLEAHYEQSQ